MPLEELSVGSRITIDLDMPEATAHLLGDPRHASVYMATGRFVAVLSNPPPPDKLQ
jgi:hypothetical protein